MRYNAKVTSKGQITIPADVRRALELEPGASVAFEVSEDHAVLTRQQTPEEYFAEVRRRYPLPPRKYSSDREGIEAHVREKWEKKRLGPGWIVEAGKARPAGVEDEEW
jgi:AbrB family looped-hinge helix DNA binding protein